MGDVPKGLPEGKVLWEVLWTWIGKGMQLVTVIGVVWLNVSKGDYFMIGVLTIAAVVAGLLAFWDFKNLYGKCQDVVLERTPSWQEMRENIKAIRASLEAMDGRPR
jgi:hypothetical protein